ncbi:hypothetical protein GGD63_007132 [Bradyrhizobium sp. cir1]|uniref:hypothetical protein n=1 Tax=Bradyrhizobium sp. cir1 TaxID=1445730 RepID=UPI001606E42F|nr:hypothetical protein [Bradyrhizobium sp. cir1]MBB4374302.1 hypothetical protein [Bradyrhizobium sp. cir1]
MTSDHRAEFFALLERAVRVGALLPDPDDIDLSDANAVADLKMVLPEFFVAHAEIEALLD